MKLAFKSGQHGILVFKCLVLSNIKYEYMAFSLVLQPVRVWVSCSGSY